MPASKRFAARAHLESSSFKAHLESSSFERLFEIYGDFLQGISVQKFGVPADEAEALVHDVFLGYFRDPAHVHDVHAWLIGAICNASREYLRRTRRRREILDDYELLEGPELATADVLRNLPEVLAIREMLTQLRGRDAEVLRLRFFEGLSSAEIAARLGLKPASARKLLTRSLRRAEAVYLKGAEGKPAEDWRQSEAVLAVLTAFVNIYGEM